MSSILSTIALLGSIATYANAHGTVQGILAADKYYTGYNPSFQYQSTPPVVIGWSIPEDQDNGYVADYTSNDMICHKGATNAGTSAEIAAGDKVTFDWTTWPESHHGPVLTYLAKCDGECEKVDKTTLKWFKIAEAGLIDDSSVPGKWASDELIANNQSSTVTIPSSLAAGNYVARHEIIALHSAGTSGGAQNYPQCVNLKVTSTGTAEPEGVVGTSLYTAEDPGILVNIYAALTYTIPGPTLWSGAATGSATAASSAAATSAPASTTPAASSTASVTTQGAIVTSAAASASASATPTAASSSAAASATGSATRPSKSLPSGTTIEDLLSWVQELFDEKNSSANSKAKRAHARDILRAMRA